MKEDVDASRGESVETKSSKSKMIRVESEENTRLRFVECWHSVGKKQRNQLSCRAPSANHEGPFISVTIAAVKKAVRYWQFASVLEQCCNGQIVQQGKPRLNSTGHGDSNNRKKRGTAAGGARCVEAK